MPSFESSLILFLSSILHTAQLIIFLFALHLRQLILIRPIYFLTCVPSYVRTMLGMANYPGHSSLTAIEIMRLKDAFQEYSSSKRREQIIKEVSDYELRVN